MKNCITTQQVCQRYGLKSNTVLLEALQKRGIFRRTKDKRFMPTPAYAGFDLVRYKYNKGWRMYWTPAGVDFLYDQLNGQLRIAVRKTYA